eukprot:jgi/Bigna1/89082/estExt_fgenesh1_pg.C_430072
MASSSKLMMWTPFEKVKELEAGKDVRLVGKVVSFDEEEAIIESSSAQIKVLKPNVNNYNTRFVEVFGTIRNNADSQPSIEESKSVPFGENFNLKHFNRMVTLTQGRFTSLFGSASSSIAANSENAMEEGLIVQILENACGRKQLQKCLPLLKQLVQLHLLCHKFCKLAQGCAHTSFWLCIIVEFQHTLARAQKLLSIERLRDHAPRFRFDGIVEMPDSAATQKVQKIPNRHDLSFKDSFNHSSTFIRTHQKVLSSFKKKIKTPRLAETTVFGAQLLDCAKMTTCVVSLQS